MRSGASAVLAQLRAWSLPLGRLLLLLLCMPAASRAELPGGDELWLTPPPRVPAVELYFFWSNRCPHCQEARPFVASLPARYPWIRVHSLEILEHPENLARFEQLAGALGIRASAVPTFMWCGEHITGYAGEHSTGRVVLAGLSDCYRRHFGALPGAAAEPAPGGAPVGAEPAPEQRIEIPWLGSLDPASHSLPVTAVLLGALDAFNPCAFFVLLFLLSLLVNSRSRKRMLLVGGVFVSVSGLIYFAFMAAWLNLFQVLGSVQAITLGAGLVAIGIGLINIKDYFRLHQGVSLSLSQQHRSRLFTRMRGLLGTDHLPALLLGTLALALAANSYELLCTMGLPMVFTRILTLQQLPTLQYYAYLALYNLVYVLPLAAIVGLFVATMGRRKLTVSEGRFLKLLSGSMMTGLGLVLVTAPDALSRPLSAVLLIAVAIAFSLALHLLRRQGRKGVRLD